MNKPNFKCPDCTHDEIEEIAYGAIVTAKVAIIDGCGIVGYSDPTWEEGEVDRYQCRQCGYVIRSENTDEPIVDTRELFKWLENH